MRKIIFITLIVASQLATAFSVFAQSTLVSKSFFSVEELKQDFDIFRASLEEAHPGLYRYKSKAFYGFIIYSI
ncbi:MAG: hypothetical protein IPJ60_01540 [Sphingobacteriaceae bacterium]|nr:hypothetical protein [Sphingobacteriaceae bacterium]